MYISSADMFGAAGYQVIMCNFLPYVKMWDFPTLFNLVETNNAVRIPVPCLKWNMVHNQIKKYVNNQQNAF